MDGKWPQKAASLQRCHDEPRKQIQFLLAVDPTYKIPFTLVKGQLISKGLFGFFNYPKKQTKIFCPSRLGQKLTFSISFFGVIEATKIFFRD